MKLLKLTKGFSAMVDDSDYDFLSQWPWHVTVQSGGTYAQCTSMDGESVKLSMHRFIMQAAPKDFVDHIDGNGLNNQRSNLRLATKAQNGANSKLSKRNSSGFKGVAKDGSGWRVQVSKNGKNTWVGYYTNKTEAARAYDSAAVESFGDYARTNKKLGLIN